MEENKMFRIISGYDVGNEFPELSEENKGLIIIDNSQETPRLQVIGEERVDEDDSELKWLTVSGIDSDITVIKSSELEWELRNRDWNIYGRLFVEKDEKEMVEKLYLTSPEVSQDPIPNISDLRSEKSEAKCLFSNPISIPIINSSTTTTTTTSTVAPDINTEPDFIKEFNEIYEKLINMRTYEEGGITFGSINYYNLISYRDLEKDSLVIDLISLGGSSYTSVVNLNSLFDFSQDYKSNYDFLLVAGIDYEISGMAFSKEISFKPFQIIDGVYNNSKDLIFNISEYVEADYHDRCFRIFPKTNNVDECVISYCYIVCQPE